MNEDVVDPSYYVLIVKKLNHLMHTYLDISYVVGITNRYLSKPYILNLQATKKILCYIIRIKEYRILY